MHFRLLEMLCPWRGLPGPEGFSGTGTRVWAVQPEDMLWEAGPPVGPSAARGHQPVTSKPLWLERASHGTSRLSLFMREPRAAGSAPCRCVVQSKPASPQRVAHSWQTLAGPFSSEATRSAPSVTLAMCLSQGPSPTCPPCSEGGFVHPRPRSQAAATPVQSALDAVETVTLLASRVEVKAR